MRYWVLCGIIALMGCVSKSSTHPKEAEQRVVVENYIEYDVWYGPGFYYGIWFINENDYWVWRRRHRGWPPNRHYYHRHKRIYYHPRKGESHSGGRHKGSEQGSGGHGGGRHEGSEHKGSRHGDGGRGGGKGHGH